MCINIQLKQTLHFLDGLIREITVKLYVSQLRISNDVKHYVRNNSLYVTYSIYPLLKKIPEISTQSNFCFSKAEHFVVINNIN